MSAAFARHPVAGDQASLARAQAEACRVAVRLVHSCPRPQQRPQAVGAARRWVAAAAAGSNGSSSHANGVRQQAAGVDLLEQQQPQQQEQQQGQQQGQQPAAGQHPRVWTKFVAETLLPTKLGKFRLRGYRHTVDGGLTYTEPSVIISGSPEGRADVAVRVHDACFTSEVGVLPCSATCMPVLAAGAGPPCRSLPTLHWLSRHSALHTLWQGVSWTPPSVSLCLKQLQPPCPVA